MSTSAKESQRYQKQSVSKSFTTSCNNCDRLERKIDALMLRLERGGFNTGQTPIAKKKRKPIEQQ